VSLRVAVASEGVRSPVAGARLAAAAQLALRAEGVRDAMLSVALVSKARMAAINSRHLGHRGPTDVISFGFARERGGAVVGDVYIAPEVARANARRHGVGVREEVMRLVVHGVLHVLGYDHPAGDDRERSAMWRRQEKLLARAMRAGAA
jgi:probable rRNA maturation factor